MLTGPIGKPKDLRLIHSFPFTVYHSDRYYWLTRVFDKKGVFLQSISLRANIADLSISSSNKQAWAKLSLNPNLIMSTSIHSVSYLPL